MVNCLCGCGQPVRAGKRFVHGHAQLAAMAVVELQYGDIASFMRVHGYGPGERNAHREFTKYIDKLWVQYEKSRKPRRNRGRAA